MKHLKLLKIQTIMYIKGVLLQWFMNFLIKLSGGAIKNEIMPIKDLAKELHKQIIRKFQKRKVHSSFIDDIRGMEYTGKDGWVIFLWKIKRHYNY